MKFPKLALFSLLALAFILYPEPARAEVPIRHVYLSVGDCTLKKTIEDGLSRRLAKLNGFIVVQDVGKADNIFYIMQANFILRESKAILESKTLEGYAISVIYTSRPKVGPDGYQYSELSVCPASELEGELDRITKSIDFFYKTRPLTQENPDLFLEKQFPLPSPKPFLPPKSDLDALFPDPLSDPLYSTPKIPDAADITVAPKIPKAFLPPKNPEPFLPPPSPAPSAASESGHTRENYQEGDDRYIWFDWKYPRSGLAYRSGVRVNQKKGEIVTLMELWNTSSSGLKNPLTVSVINDVHGQKFDFSVNLSPNEKKTVSHVIMPASPVSPPLLQAMLEKDLFTKEVAEWHWEIE